MSTPSIKELLTKKKNIVQEHVVYYLPVTELCHMVSEYDQNLFLFRSTSQQPITNRKVWCFSCQKNNCVLHDNDLRSCPFTICPQGHVECHLLTWKTSTQRKALRCSSDVHEPVQEPMLNFFVNVTEFETCFTGSPIYSANSNPQYFISSETACFIYLEL